jgi:hypothetical protein
VPCGGHAWSRDGLSWSNQTIGAFGPVIRWANGTFFTGAYAERPQVIQDASGAPIAFYTGFGMHSYSDSHNFAQLFCTASSPAGACGPTRPPAAKRFRFAQRGACLVANASVFPCAGGRAESCPMSLGACGDATAVWTYEAVSGMIANAAPLYADKGSFFNLDCGACKAGTIAKVIDDAHFAQAVDFDAAAGTLRARDCAAEGLCLTGAAAAVRAPPCGPPGEWTTPTQLALVACTDAAAGGWTMTPA